VADRVELGAYYIVSEVLANVAKHANAEMVTVSVEAGRGVLSVSVRDDGVGGADPPGRGTSWETHARQPPSPQQRGDRATGPTCPSTRRSEEPAG
jgi:anti-sigma regulatory factor (Ser/Thr protein kinase)